MGVWKRFEKEVRVHLGKKKEDTPQNTKNTKAVKLKEERKKQEEKKGNE